MRELLIERDDTLKIVHLNRPSRANSLNSNLVESLYETILESANDGTRTFVLQGEGKSFCSGFDLSDLESSNDSQVAQRILRVEKLLQALHHAPFTTVAMAHTRAFGAGADLVCSCHIRIAEPDTKFCMPGLNFGILLGTRRLTLRVGVDNALSILTNTRVFGSNEALQMGFLTQIAKKSQWNEIIEASNQVASALPISYASRMFEVVIPDTRSEDLADLTKAVNETGLVARIIKYKNSMRQNSGKKPS